MSLHDSSCIAWWYLDCGVGNSHCYVAVFVHNQRGDFSVQIAEGKSRMSGFAKDEYIAKHSWEFESSTCRKALSRVLKFATQIVADRTKRGFTVIHSSYGKGTGLGSCFDMELWERVCAPGISKPAWWPVSSLAKSEQLPRPWSRRACDQEGFDMSSLIATAVTKKRAKGKVFRRVGRFTVYQKGI